MIILQHDQCKTRIALRVDACKGLADKRMSLNCEGILEPNLMRFHDV
jgi:hypothetical protein